MREVRIQAQGVRAIVEAILDGRLPEAMTLPGLMDPFPVERQLRHSVRVSQASSPLREPQGPDALTARWSDRPAIWAMWDWIASLALGDSVVVDGRLSSGHGGIIAVEEASMNRRYFLAATGSLSLARYAAAQPAWPDRPVTIIVPSGVGSVPDLMARLAAPTRSARWGQPVVVQNVVGAAGMLGVERAAPDGHTLVLLR